MDLTPSEDERELRALARHLAATSIAPAVEAAERDGDGHLDLPAFRAVVRDAAKAGVLGLLVPPEYGGGGQGALAAALVAEELGAADAGIAAALNLTMTVPAMVAAAGTDAQKELVLRAAASDEGLVVAGALSEADVAGSELFDPAPVPERGIRTRAVPVSDEQGDGWVIDGMKSGWVTNAGAADAYVVFARTEPDRPAATGTTAFWVPADTAGVRVGSRTSFLGMRSAFHAEVAFDGVRLPADALIGPRGGGLGLMQSATPAMVVGLAAVFVGVARAAAEAAVAYAGERRSWGRPLREHQLVAVQLADAVTTHRRARLAVWEAAALLDDVTAGRGGDPADLGVLLPSCKEHAVTAAIANAERAVKVFGAAGVASGAGPEKLLRDAWTGYACDFTGDLLRLATAAALPATGRVP